MAIHIPVGGLDSAKFFEALRSRPCNVDAFECPRLRVGFVALSVLGRRGFVGDDVKDGNASEAGSFVVGDTFWLELLVAGGVDGSMIDGEGARLLLPWINSRKIYN